MKPVKLTALIATVFFLVAAISCRHQDEKSGDPVFVKLTIQLDSQNYQSGGDYVLSSGTSSAMISAVPASVSSVSGSTDLSSAYDRQMLTLANNTVTLTVPLETSMRLVKAAYQSELTRANILANNPTPLFIGLSSAFTITAASTTKAVEVAMQEVVAVASTVPANAATDVAVGTTVAVTFSHAMDTATLTTITADTTCSGSLQLSTDSFSTCISMSTDPVVSGSNKTFTITPAADLAYSTAHQFRVTTSAQSANSTPLPTASTTSFTTAAQTTQLIGGTIQGNDLSLAGTAAWFAGDGSGTASDATGTAAGIPGPYGITTDGTYLYVADDLQHTIRRIEISTGVVDTIAGVNGSPGNTDADGTSASFNTPTGITTDGTYLYVSDRGTHIIRRVTLTSPFTVITLAGLSGSAGYNDADGTAAEFNEPYGLTFDDTYLYIADRLNHAIRSMTLASPYTVTNVAGSTTSTSGDMDATGTAALFNNPTDITISSDKTTLYFTDMINGDVRSVVISTRVSATFATGFNYPRGITTDGTNIYVSDTDNYRIAVFSISSPGTVNNLAGLSGTFGCTGGTGTVARFTLLKGLTTDGTSLFVAENSTAANCRRVFKID